MSWFQVLFYCHTRCTNHLVKFKGLFNQGRAPSSETNGSHFSNMEWRDLTEPLCSFSTSISSSSSSSSFLLLRAARKPSTASNPWRWLTAQQALYHTMGLTCYRPTVDRYRPEGGRGRSKGRSVNPDWNVATVKLHVKRRVPVGLCQVEECVCVQVYC